MPRLAMHYCGLQLPLDSLTDLHFCWPSLLANCDPNQLWSTSRSASKPGNVLQIGWYVSLGTREDMAATWTLTVDETVAFSLTPLLCRCSVGFQGMWHSQRGSRCKAAVDGGCTL